MSKRLPQLYLNDIKESLESIDKYVDGLTFGSFTNDRKTVDAVARNFSIIGEAAKNLPDEIKLKYPEVPWVEIIGMRNKATHEYWSVDEEIFWQTIKNDLPIFQKQIEDILEAEK